MFAQRGEGGLSQMQTKWTRERRFDSMWTSALIQQCCLLLLVLMCDACV